MGWGSLQHCPYAPDSLAVYKGPTSKGKEGKDSGRGGKGKGKGRERTLGWDWAHPKILAWRPYGLGSRKA